MTLLQLCKEIRQTMGYLPNEEGNDIKRTYEITWQIVFLTCQRLVNPAENSRGRLEDLYAVVDRARESHIPGSPHYKRSR